MCEENNGMYEENNGMYDAIKVALFNGVSLPCSACLTSYTCGSHCVDQKLGGG